jgi:hypothetical protein
MQLTKFASTEPKLSKILKKTIKKAISSQGIAPSTRSGNKELDLLIRKIAKQSPTIEQVTAIAEKIAATIVHLSKQQGKTALDRGIIRQIAFHKDFTSLIVVPLPEVVSPAIVITQTEAVTLNPVVEEPETEEPSAELTEEPEIEEPEIEESTAEFTEEPEIEAEPEIEEPAAESTEEPEIEEPAAELTETPEIEELEIEESTAELTEEPVGVTGRLKALLNKEHKGVRSKKIGLRSQQSLSY